MIDIRIKYLNETVKRLQKIEIGDWIDVYSAEHVELKQFEYKLIHLGFALELPDKYEAHLVPRSSTFKNWGIIQTNSMGVIDNSYCGDNDYWKMPVLAMRDTVIEKGDKIAQFRIVHKQPKINFVEVEILGNKDRNGLGSTGTK